MEPITVKYKVLDARAKVPAYATPGAAAADLCAVLDAPLTVAPMQRVLVPPALPSSCPVPTACTGVRTQRPFHQARPVHGKRRGCGGQRLSRGTEGAHDQSGHRGLYHPAVSVWHSSALHRCIPLPLLRRLNWGIPSAARAALAQRGSEAYERSDPGFPEPPAGKNC